VNTEFNLRVDNFCYRVSKKTEKKKSAKSKVTKIQSQTGVDVGKIVEDTKGSLEAGDL
jgi:hypothetical protein